VIGYGGNVDIIIYYYLIDYYYSIENINVIILLHSFALRIFVL